MVGMINTQLAFVVILSNLFLFFRKERYFEALFGFFFLLVLSDNTEELWRFAKDIKPFYLITFAALIFTQYNKLITTTKIFKFIIPYLIVGVVSLIFAKEENFFIGIQKMISYSLIFIAIPNIVMFEYERIGEEFFANLIAYSVIIHFIGLSVIITFPEVGMSHGGRWQGALGNPNGLGLFLIVFYTAFRSIDHEFPKLFSRNERVFYFLLTFILLWMSGSRTALLSITAFEIAYNGFKYSKGLTVLLIATILIYFNQIYDIIIDGLISLGLSSSLRLDNLESGSGRLIAWQFAFNHIWDNTLFVGKGFGYDEFLMRSNFMYLSRLGHEGGVHNSYLIMWLNTGLIGLIAFMFGFLKLFIEGFKKKRYAFPLLLAVLISATFEPWITSSLNPYTVILLVTMTLMLCINTDEKVELEEAIA